MFVATLDRPFFLTHAPLRLQMAVENYFLRTTRVMDVRYW
jgi:hypothetical protein